MAQWEECLLKLHKSGFNPKRSINQTLRDNADTFNTWREANGLGAPSHPET